MMFGVAVLRFCIDFRLEFISAVYLYNLTGTQKCNMLLMFKAAFSECFHHKGAAKTQE